jgi:tetratricopeptide (TPR) repeat protein
LIVENLDDLFSGLGEQGQQHLRAFLQTYTNCTILATSSRLFNGVQRRTAPFYGFFRPVHLSELTAAEAQQLLVNIARLRQQTDLATFLQTPTGQKRVQAVQHLAGGNPRIYIIFADFLTQQSLEELVSPFMSLVDVLTPYYQSRMQFLSPQQRKIVELLCEKKYPQSVKTIAQRCFMTAQTASSQLKELKEKGYVKVEAIGREAFYDMTEPLMRICLGVKKERGEPLRLIVNFLRAWYPQPELQAMRQQLLMAPKQSAVICRYLDQALNYGAITDEDPRIQAYLNNIQAHFEQENYEGALKIAEKLLQVHESWVERERYAACLSNLGRYEEALINDEKAIELNPDYYKAWKSRGDDLLDLNRHEEAISSYDQALKINPDLEHAWHNRGTALTNLGRYKEAISSFDEAIRINPDSECAWNNKGVALYSLSSFEEWIGNKELCCYEEAITSFKRALKINPDSKNAWDSLGNVFSDLGRHEEAIAAFDKALRIDPNDQFVWSNRGNAFSNSGRYEEAVACLDKALKINPENKLVKILRFSVLRALNSWTANYKALETLLNEGDLIDSKPLEPVVWSLFRTIEDTQQWQINIVKLANLLEGRSLLNELGVALVRTIGELASELVSLAKASAWLDAWKAAVGNKPEFEIPLRLLNTTLHYKQTPNDPRVLLELPTEERKILQQALKIDGSTDAIDKFFVA